MPGTLGDMPTAATVPPGNCVFGEDWKPSPLLVRHQVNHNTILLRFGLPDGTALGLSTCACILAKCGQDDTGEPVVRPYTPMSTNALTGAFELLVKVYPDGKASQHLAKLPIGDSVEFKHIKFNVKEQYPFQKQKIAMLVGGTGITPMIQAAHAILGTAGDTSEIVMLYGNRTQEDILAKETLERWAEAFPSRFRLVHVLSHERTDSNWAGERGFITGDLISKHVAPTDDLKVFVCGPPPMYAALCGDRGEKELTGALANLGYTAEQVVKF